MSEQQATYRLHRLREAKRAAVARADPDNDLVGFMQGLSPFDEPERTGVQVSFLTDSELVREIERYEALVDDPDGDSFHAKLLRSLRRLRPPLAVPPDEQGRDAGGGKRRDMSEQLTPEQPIPLTVTPADGTVADLLNVLRSAERQLQHGNMSHAAEDVGRAIEIVEGWVT